MLSTVVGLVCLLVSGIAVGVAFKTRIETRDELVRVVKWVRNNNKASVSLKRMSKLEAEMTDIVDSVASIHESLRKLRSRVGMRKVRADRENAADVIPDSKTDPAGYKRHMRLQLHGKVPGF